MRHLWFGGTFNPIHYGHLICAAAVAERAAFDRVILVPSFLPPHKLNPADLAAATDRLLMCRLAVSGSERFEVDDLELKRTGPSFTLETARMLAKRTSSPRPIHWLIGADTLPQLLSWHEPERLLEEVQFVVMARPGTTIDWNALPARLSALRENLVEAPLIDISATDIRRRVAAGRSIDYLTPPAVCRYIHDRGLYVRA